MNIQVIVAKQLIVFVLLLFVNAAGYTKEFSEKRFPLDINIEGKYQRTTMQLVLPMKIYPARLTELRPETLDEPERDAIRFLDAIKNNDLEHIRATLASIENQVQKSEIVNIVKTPEQFLLGYRQAFKEFRDVMLIGRLMTDKGILFLWQGSTDRGPLLRGFLMTKVGQKNKLVELNMSTYPVETFVVNALGRLNLTEFSTQVNTTSKNKGGYAVPLNGVGWKIVFKGRPINVDLIRPIPAKEKGLYVVSQKIRYLADGQMDKFYKLYTTHSVAKLKSWRETMSQEQFSAFRQFQSRPRTAKFILDAGVIHLIFASNTGDLTSHILTPELSYDYVMSHSSEYHLANIFYESFFDDLLKAIPDLPGIIANNNLVAN